MSSSALRAEDEVTADGEAAVADVKKVEEEAAAQDVVAGHMEVSAMTGIGKALEREEVAASMAEVEKVVEPQESVAPTVAAGHTETSGMPSSGLQETSLGAAPKTYVGGEDLAPLVLMLGAPGSGKSVVASMLAHKYGCTLVSLDELIRREVVNGSARGRRLSRLIHTRKVMPMVELIDFFGDQFTRPAYPGGVILIEARFP